jgi:hypothetical protein
MAFGIPNLERELSNFLEGNNGITAIRSVEFDKRFLWAIDFVNTFTPPAPFDNFFPASEVSFGMSNVNTKTIPYGQRELEIPINESPREVSITFYDDTSQTLLRYFKDWMELDIKNNGQFMSGLEDNHPIVTTDSFGNGQRRVFPSRTIRLTHLDAYRTQNSIYSYRIFPKGQIDFLGSQASEATEYTVQFAIVDDLSAKPQNRSIGGFSFDTVRQSLGRFL